MLYIHVHVYNIHITFHRSILAKFSALAVLSLAESASMASTPVSLGVAKPMGASSVSAEYSSTSHRPTASAPYRGSFRCVCVCVCVCVVRVFEGEYVCVHVCVHV